MGATRKGFLFVAVVVASACSGSAHTLSGSAHTLSAQEAITAHRVYSQRISAALSQGAQSITSGETSSALGLPDSSCAIIRGIAEEEAQKVVPKLDKSKIGTLVTQSNAAALTLGKSCVGFDRVMAAEDALISADKALVTECAGEHLDC